MSRSSGSCFPVQEGSGADTCPATQDLVSLLMRASVLSRVPRHWTVPPYSGGLQRCHVSHDTGPCLPAWEGSDTATCSMAPDPASLLGRASALPHVPRHRTPPPCSGGLGRCHVSHGTRSCLPAWEGFGAVTCPTALDPASLLGRALVLPCVPQLYGPQTSRIKKALDDLPMRLDLRVLKACSHVTKTPDT
jgi:hypothetical protein